MAASARAVASALVGLLAAASMLHAVLGDAVGQVPWAWLVPQGGLDFHVVAGALAVAPVIALRRSPVAAGVAAGLVAASASETQWHGTHVLVSWLAVTALVTYGVIASSRASTEPAAWRLTFTAAVVTLLFVAVVAECTCWPEAMREGAHWRVTPSPGLFVAAVALGYALIELARRRTRSLVVLVLASGALLIAHFERIARGCVGVDGPLLRILGQDEIVARTLLPTALMVLWAWPIARYLRARPCV